MTRSMLGSRALRSIFALSALGATLAAPAHAQRAAPAASAATSEAPALAPAKPVRAARNVVLFVADGLRHDIVTAQTAPTLWRVMHEGVAFANAHAHYPTLTTTNASAIATGHLPGDTGDYANTLYEPGGLASAQGSVTPFIENDVVLGEMNARHGGNFLGEETLLARARRAGVMTASVGKLGPAAMMDVTERAGLTIVVDDRTGTPEGLPLPAEIETALGAATLPLQTPGRGGNGLPRTASANVYQQGYLSAVTSQVILPYFVKRQQEKPETPFLLVFWSRDPDGTQHGHGDGVRADGSGDLHPGINGPTSLAGVRNADDSLARLLASLKALGLDGRTDVVITADHGFSTIWKQPSTANDPKPWIGRTSHAATLTTKNVPAGWLPPGFVAIDVAHAMGVPVYDPERAYKALGPGERPTTGSAVLGDPRSPEVVVTANGGSDLIYLPGAERRCARAHAVTAALLAQDYTSGVFVDDDVCKGASSANAKAGSSPIPGTLPLSSIGLVGSARTERPAIVVSFASAQRRDPSCPTPLACTIEVADTGIAQGQGMHGSFGRADTFPFSAAIGPSFKTQFVDRMPTSNADIGQTVAMLLGLKLAEPARGSLVGRPLDEALTGGALREVTSGTLTSAPAANSVKTVVRWQQVGTTRYFTVGGTPGRTSGL